MKEIRKFKVKASEIIIKDITDLEDAVSAIHPFGAQCRISMVLHDHDGNAIAAFSPWQAHKLADSLERLAFSEGSETHENITKYKDTLACTVFLFATGNKASGLIAKFVRSRHD